MDITEVILTQHHRQRQAFAQLDEIPRDDAAALAAAWDRLVVFLEVHAEAEERFFYPEVLRLGEGPPGDDGPEDETEDAIKDHNEIRDGIREAARHAVGSDAWWKGVRRARMANSEHMAEEEDDDLMDFRLHADLQTRHDIAVTFLAFEAEHGGAGVALVDKDPEEYVEDPPHES